MNDERRRYFRIDEMIGISYKIITHHDASETSAPDVLDLVCEQDERLQTLIVELKSESPKVAEIISIFNQKLERVVNQLYLENKLINKIAQRVREANISACGIAFINDESIALNASLAMELTFYPDEQHITTHGRVVGCDPVEHERNKYYWRIDFVGMDKQAQEELIQLIVRRQSAQLKKLRSN